MSYRSDVDALNARKTALTGDVAGKQRELAEVDRLIREVEAKAKLPLLDNIRVASPCPVAWASMVGDDRKRACADCKKNVYNLSGMTRDEAYALLEGNDDLCIRYFQRADGTILLADCEVGVARVRGRRRIAAIGAAAIIAGAGGVRVAGKLASDEEPAQQRPMAVMGALPVRTLVATQGYADRSDQVLGRMGAQLGMTVEELAEANRALEAELAELDGVRARARVAHADAVARAEAANADREAAVAAAAEAQRSLDESRRLLEAERARIQRLNGLRGDARFDGVTDLAPAPAVDDTLR